jgi:hypothetical protein
MIKQNGRNKGGENERFKEQGKRQVRNVERRRRKCLS